MLRTRLDPVWAKPSSGTSTNVILEVTIGTPSISQVSVSEELAGSFYISVEIHISISYSRRLLGFFHTILPYHKKGMASIIFSFSDNLSGTHIYLISGMWKVSFICGKRQILVMPKVTGLISYPRVLICILPSSYHHISFIPSPPLLLRSCLPAGVHQPVHPGGGQDHRWVGRYPRPDPHGRPPSRRGSD